MERIKTLLLIGVILLVVGLGLLTFYPDSNAENVKIAQNATNAYDAARQISSNNQSDMLVHFVSMFCIGLGGTITVLSVLQLNKLKKQA